MYCHVFFRFTVYKLHLFRKSLSEWTLQKNNLVLFPMCYGLLSIFFGFIGFLHCVALLNILVTERLIVNELTILVIEFKLTYVCILCVQTISDLHYYAVPVILITFFSYLVADCFLSVYDVSLALYVICWNCIWSVMW